MSVIIVGGGIAGLSLALSLHQAGIAARVFEQVSAIRPLGVGINVQPHAVRELFEMGLEAELEAIGVRTQEVAYFSKRGRLIWSEPRGRFAGYDWPQFSVHRGMPQTMLFDAVRKRLGAGAVVTGMAASAADGAAVAGARVAVVSKEGLQAQTTTDADGRFDAAVRVRGWCAVDCAADGFFPATGAQVDTAPLIDLMRRTAEEAGRDPAAIELTTGCPGALPGSGTDPLEAVQEAAARGIDRVALPLTPFLQGLDEKLAEFGETVIAKINA